MADSTAEESPAQRAARLRREKREKKILDGGSDRLARITNVSGRQEDLQPSFPPKPTVSSDPGDVDIPFVPPSLAAQGNSTAGAAAAAPNADDIARLRAAMRSQSPTVSGPGSPPSGGPNDQAAADDPMAQLMQQMSQMFGLPMPDGSAPGGSIPGGAGAGAGAGAGGPELPPALASLLSGQPMMGAKEAQAQTPSTNTYIWRIVHAIFSISLGLYIIANFQFTGLKSDRDSFSLAPTQGFFWIFATVELGLQSTRYLLEKGQSPQTGMIAKVAGFLPEPYRGYLLLISRYSTIWSTLSEDAMVVLFVVGCSIWWKGEVE